MSLSAIAQSQANSNARSLIMNAGNSYMKGEYTECASMLKDIVPSLSDAYEILTGYNLYLMASLRCDTLLAETALEQCANSVKEKLLPDIYQNQTEYERQLVWRITALSLHQHAMSIALGSKSDTTKKLAYRLVQVAKNLEVEADQYARTVMAKNSMTNAILINRYDRQKDSLYFSYGNMAADSLAFKIEMNKMMINKQIPIHEVFDKVSDYEQIRKSLPVNATMVEYCIYRAISGEDRYGAFIFDNMTSTLSTYQTRICINLCHKLIERKKGISMIPLADNADDLQDSRVLSMDKVSFLSETVSESECDDSEAVYQVREVLKKIGEKCRHILMGMYADHFKQEVIAAQLGYTNADTVKAIAYRCKKRFREMFANFDH